MKKNFFSVALIALSVFTFSSCNEDEEPVIIPPVTSTGASAIVNAAYSPLQSLSSSYSFLVESATETTISFEEEVDNIDGPQISRLETQKNNWYPTKVFGRLYQSIALANTAIEQINAIPLSDELNQEGKDLLIARAKFIRGYDYFQLVQLFGEVPLIVSANATSTEQSTRKPIDDVYNQVVSDLTAAIEKLPESDPDKSKPTQLAAKTILAKAYLTWGQKPLSQSEIEAIATSKADPAKPAIDNAKLKQALTYANAVISSGKYSLVSNYNNIWGVSNENNAEVIFSIYHEGDDIDVQGNHQTHCGFTWPGSERTDPHISYADITLENLIPAGDARRAYSYTTSVEYADGKTDKDTLTWPLSIVRPGKWIHRDAAGKSLALQPNNIDHIDFRLAEVYLIKAEAQLLLSDGDKGLAALNTLRKRAGVTELTAVTTDALQKEWSYELAFEQKHWLNLVRWRTLIASIDKVKGYEYYKAAYNDETAFAALSGADVTRFAFYQRVYTHLHAKVDNINGHLYRFPIPATGLDAKTPLGVVGQNPGY